MLDSLVKYSEATPLAILIGVSIIFAAVLIPAYLKHRKND